MANAKSNIQSNGFAPFVFQSGYDGFAVGYVAPSLHAINRLNAAGLKAAAVIPVKDAVLNNPLKFVEPGVQLNEEERKTLLGATKNVPWDLYANAIGVYPDESQAEQVKCAMHMSAMLEAFGFSTTLNGGDGDPGPDEHADKSSDDDGRSAKRLRVGGVVGDDDDEDEWEDVPFQGGFTRLQRRVVAVDVAHDDEDDDEAMLLGQL